jgi:hypothetical protein
VVSEIVQFVQANASWLVLAVLFGAMLLMHRAGGCGMSHERHPSPLTGTSPSDQRSGTRQDGEPMSQGAGVTRSKACH